MKNIYFYLRFFVLVTVLTCFGPMFAGQPVWAQEGEGADIEIVVTADRMETETTRIPAHVTVVTAEEMKGKGAETVVEALQGLSGLSLRNVNDNPALAEISLRGFGENSHGRVLVLLDGVRLNRPDMAGLNWLQIPVEDVERIEIVRGGGSTLYGDHAVGGVVNIITKKGGARPGLAAFAAGGSFYQNQERLGVEGPLGPFTLALNGEHTASRGYRDHSAYESLGAGLDAGWGITDSIYASLRISYSWLDYELPGYLTAAQMRDDPTQSLPLNDQGKTENHHLNTLLNTRILLGEWGRLDADLFYNLKIMKDDMPSWVSFTDKYLHSLGFCPRLSGSFILFNLPHTLTLGSDLEWDAFDLNRYTEAERNNKDLAVLISKGSAGAYLNDEIGLADTLYLSAGLRYETAVIKADASLGTDVHGEKIHQALVGSGGIAWEFIPLSKLYGRFELLYRYPFIDEQVSYYGFGADEVYRDLEAEKGYNIEAGGELCLFARKLNVRGNFFYLIMDDEIAWNSATFRNENLAATRHMGVEAEAEIKAGDWLKILGNYTYTQAVFISGENNGKFLPLVPQHNAFAELTLYLPLGFSLGSSLDYTGSCYAGGDYDNARDKLAGFFLLNAFFRCIPKNIPGNLQIMLGLQNILNESYVTSGFYSGWLGAIAYYPEPGFSWKISVSYGIEL